MCGISGFINFNDFFVKEEKLKKMLLLQNHRGPDSQGIIYLKNVGFAHNRLSLLDLSKSGNQPFEDDNFILTYNGEIYNNLEIKKELNEIDFKSSSDTAVLFEAIKKWGIDKTLEKIKGMFAFSWYNKTSNELFLVRDRLGIKPLFYSLDNEKTYWFASEVKAILSIMKAEINSNKILFSGLGILERSRSNTVWNNIKQVEPGTYLKLIKNDLKIVKYYSIFDTVNENKYNNLFKSSLNDVKNELKDLIYNSVNEMAVSDAPMGTFVSGGIDSSIIARISSEKFPDLKLFTANVLGKHSEFKDAQQLAKYLNKELFDYPFKKESILNDWAKSTWHYETPIVVHFNAIPFSNVAKLAREHNVKAVLTGEGSDELFLGYAPLLTKRYEKFINLPFSTLTYLYKKIPKLYSFISKTGGSQDLLNIYKNANENFSNELNFNEGLKYYNFIDKKLQKEHLETAKMLHEHLVSLLWRNDRMGMMHSIESRFPFLNEDIIAFSMNLPTKFKIGKSFKFHNYKHPYLIDKYIVRKMAEDILPKNLVYKNKNGFPVTGLRDLIVSANFFENSTITDILQLSQIEVKYMCDNSNNYLTSIMASIEIWAKLFVENKSIEEVDLLIQKYISFK